MPPQELDAKTALGESRWPPALALVLFMAINIALRVWLPHEGAVRVAWAVPAVEGVLLVLLLIGPATGASERRWIRPLAVTFVLVLVLAALWATAVLIRDLIDGSGVTQSPSELLASGAVVWLGVFGGLNLLGTGCVVLLALVVFGYIFLLQTLAGF